MVEIMEFKDLRKIKKDAFCNFIQKYVLLLIKLKILHQWLRHSKHTLIFTFVCIDCIFALCIFAFAFNICCCCSFSFNFILYSLLVGTQAGLLVLFGTEQWFTRAIWNETHQPGLSGSLHFIRRLIGCYQLVF